MADEIKQTLPQKLCAEYSRVCVCMFSTVFVFYLKGMKTGGARWWGSGMVGLLFVDGWGGGGGGVVMMEKKEFRHVVAYSTHICNAAYVHQLQLTFYLSELPITRTSWFFFHSQQSTLQSLCWLLRIYYYIYVRSRIQQQWTLSKVIFPGDSPAMHSFCVVP